jgi:hypothetical protein
MDPQTKATLEQMIQEGTLQPWGSCVIGDGVFFVSEQSAQIFADRHHKTLVKIETDRMTGWLAQNTR